MSAAEQVQESQQRIMAHDGDLLTPKIAMLRTTAALSADVSVSKVEAMMPFGARRGACFSMGTLLGGILFVVGSMEVS